MSKVRPNEASSSIVIAMADQDALGSRSSRCSSKRSREADNMTDADASSKRSREANEQRRSREAHSEHPVMTDAEAWRLAKHEGLSLLTSDKSSTGYKGVINQQKHFRAILAQDGKNRHIGSFPSAAEAALAYARFLGPERVAAAAAAAAAAILDPDNLTEMDAQQQAEQEGLELLTTQKSSTGYRNVVKRHRNRFLAYFFQDGKMHTIGTFGSAPAAALAYARHVGPEGMVNQLGVERYLGKFN